MQLRNHRLFVEAPLKVNLRPICDFQWGTEGFDEGLFERMYRETVSDRHSLTIGLGDYVDSWRPTVRERFQNAMSGDIGAQQQLDNMHRDHMDKMITKLHLKELFSAGYGCLGLLDGHHYLKYLNGDTSTKYLCRVLNLPYLGEMSAFIRMSFTGKNPSVKSIGDLVIHAQHGEGGSQYIASDTSKLERKTLPNFEADIYLRGHSTKLYSGGTDVLHITKSDPPRLVARPKVWLNAGGFMRGYLEDETTYVEKKMLTPAKLGYGVIHIGLAYDNRGASKRWDIRVTT